LVVKVGPDDDNPNLPIQGTGRLIINVSDPMPPLSNTTNAMGVWMHEKLRINRKLGVADFVNPAGNRVAPGAESLQSAINDFSADASVVDLINGSSGLNAWGISGDVVAPKLTDQPINKSGAGAKSWPMATYHQFIVHHTTMPDCVKARGLVDWIFWTQTDPTALNLAAQCVAPA
jgi:hypothetical protein